MDKLHFRTPAALRKEANRTADLVLPGFQANTQGDLEGFALGLTPLVARASPAQEAPEQEGLAADGTEVEDIVEQLAFGVVEQVVAVAALGRPFAVKLVESVEEVDIVEETFDYFAGEVSGVGVLD